MKSLRRVGPLLVIVLSSLAHRSAMAQSAAPSAELALIREGRALLVEGRIDEALSRFRVAFELGRSSTALAHMGVAHGALGRFVEAEDCLRRALETEPDALMERDWLPRFQENLRVAQRQIGLLRVESDRVGVRIAINGQLVGSTPLDGPVRLPPGPARISATLEGHPVIERAITVRAGAPSASERFVFDPRAAAVHERVERRAPSAVPAATPLIVVSAAPSTARPWTALAASSGALAVVGVTTGAVGLGIAQYNAGQYREGACDLPDAPPECARALSFGRLATTTSIIGWSAGVAGTVGALIFARFAVTSAQSPRPQAWVAPAPGGLTVGGYF